MVRLISGCSCLLILMACSKSGAGSTPQETFENFKAATKAKDWKKILSCMDPDAQPMMVLMMASAAEFVTMADKDAGKELEGILKKYGLEDKDKLNKTMQGVGSDKDKSSQAAKDMLKDQDIGALYSELMNFMEKHSKPGQADFATGMKDMEGTTLKDVKIEGDKATGTTTPKSGKEGTIHFVRKNGSWYASMEK